MSKQISLRSTLFGLLELEPEPPKSRRKYHGNSPRRVYVSIGTDINGWWQSNRPETLAECADLRLALKDYRAVGKYIASFRYGNYEQRLVRLDGPSGSVMITSRKARAHFNNKIRDLEAVLKTKAGQFNNENVIFNRKQ